jgi:hypothetical protein
LAGMRPSDIKAIIAVQPEMFHRSRDTSWVTAVTEASKKASLFVLSPNHSVGVSAAHDSVSLAVWECVVCSRTIKRS